MEIRNKILISKIVLSNRYDTNLDTNNCSNFFTLILLFVRKIFVFDFLMPMVLLFLVIIRAFFNSYFNYYEI